MSQFVSFLIQEKTAKSRSNWTSPSSMYFMIHRHISPIQYYLFINSSSFIILCKYIFTSLWRRLSFFVIYRDLYNDFSLILCFMFYYLFLNFLFCGWFSCAVWCTYFKVSTTYSGRQCPVDPFQFELQLYSNIRTLLCHCIKYFDWIITMFFHFQPNTRLKVELAGQGSLAFTISTVLGVQNRGSSSPHVTPRTTHQTPTASMCSWPYPKRGSR